MRRRLRPSRFGGRIAFTTVGICLGTVAVIYIYVVAIGGAGSGHGAVKSQIIVGGLIAAALGLAIGIYYATIAASNVRRLQDAARKVADGELRNVDPGRLGRPARPARPHLQRDAAAPRRARHRPQTVHRQRLARAAHADLQPRRLRRAARRGRPEPGRAGRVRAHDAPADRAADEAGDRPARPLPARRGGDGDDAGRASTSATSPARRRASSAPAPRPTARACSCAPPSGR